MKPGRTQRSCQICGKPFYGEKDCFYRPACAREKKVDTVVRIRICQDCGTEFYGGPRARRCPDCAYRQQLEISRQHRITGSARPIGSIDKCAICGKEYTVNSGRQKYCSAACQREGVLAWQREHKKGYAKASGQEIKRIKRRRRAEKICVYCLRAFTSDRPENTCSDYCRGEQAKINMCVADLKGGRRRDMKKYEDRRDRYRQEVRNAEQDKGMQAGSRPDPETVFRSV